MTLFAYMVYNASQNNFLQYDERSFGPFSSGAEFTDAELAEDIRIRENKKDDATYVIALLQ